MLRWSEVVERHGEQVCVCLVELVGDGASQRGGLALVVGAVALGGGGCGERGGPGVAGQRVHADMTAGHGASGAVTCQCFSTRSARALVVEPCSRMLASRRNEDMELLEIVVGSAGGVDKEVVAEQSGRVPRVFQGPQAVQVRGWEGSGEDVGAGVGFETEINALEMGEEQVPAGFEIGGAAAEGGDKEIRVPPGVGGGIRRGVGDRTTCRSHGEEERAVRSSRWARPSVTAGVRWPVKPEWPWRSPWPCCSGCWARRAW